MHFQFLLITMMMLWLSRSIETRLSRHYDISKEHIDRKHYDFDVTHHKGHTGPADWSSMYPECGGREQSPIDIVTHDVKCDSNLTDFVYNGYDTVPSNNFTVFHFEKWQLAIIEADNIPISIQGNWFSSEYKFYCLYAWTGSVHEIDGRKFPLQVGIVHWNSNKYNSIIEAEKHRDGVIIFSVLVEVNDSLSLVASNQAFSDAFDDILNGVQKKVCNLSFPLVSLLPPNNRIYYKYHGSYLIPACYESIYWVVFEEHMYLKQEQMDRYINVFTHMAKQAKYTGRTVQPLNDRFVSKYCF